MLSLKKKKSELGIYSHDLYWESKLISDQIYLHEGTGLLHNNILSDSFDIQDLLETDTIDFPDQFCLKLPMGRHNFFNLSNLSRDKERFIVSYWTPFAQVNKLPWKERKYYNYLKPNLDFHDIISYEISEDFEDFSNNFIAIHFSFDDYGAKIKEVIKECERLLSEIRTDTENSLRSLDWDNEYEKDESLFTKNFLIPLLFRMGFDQVRYNHGPKEFGKDLIFSKMDEFGEKKYTAVQVKAGNVRGNIKGEVDELIGQIDDGFSIPFSKIGSKNDYYISSMIIAISGRYTENARIKIGHKVNKVLLGSISFLDKERLIELTGKYS